MSTPRWAIRVVMSWNALRPLSVKSNVTIGSPPPRWSKFCSGFLMSVPESAGLSWMIHQRSGAGGCLPFADLALLVAHDEDPDGDLEDLGVRAVLRGLRSASAAALLWKVWPLSSGCLEILLKT